MALRLAIVDTGPLYAAVDADDDSHRACVEALEAPGIQLVVPALVVAEASYLIGSRLGPDVESRFLAGLGRLDVQAPRSQDWTRIAELVAEYADLPLGATDASVVALAEHLDTDLVMTLDRRHFSAVRPRHRPALTLLPQGHPELPRTAGRP